MLYRLCLYVCIYVLYGSNSRFLKCRSNLDMKTIEICYSSWFSLVRMLIPLFFVCMSEILFSSLMEISRKLKILSGCYLSPPPIVRQITLNRDTPYQNHVTSGSFKLFWTFLEIKRLKSFSNKLPCAATIDCMYAICYMLLGGEFQLFSSVKTELYWRQTKGLKGLVGLYGLMITIQTGSH